MLFELRNPCTLSVVAECSGEYEAPVRVAGEWRQQATAVDPAPTAVANVDGEADRVVGDSIHRREERIDVACRNCVENVLSDQVLGRYAQDLRDVAADRRDREVG